MAFFFAKRDFKERYIGTSLGQIWYLLSPSITIFIYTVIFSDFMKMKMNIIDHSYAYSIYLVPGLLAWSAFSTLISRLTSSFMDKAPLIKKVNVPMYIFQLSIAITEFFLVCIAMFIGVIFLWIVNHPIGWYLLWLIPILMMQTCFAFGLGIVFSLFVPFFKDLKEAIPVVLQLWFWATPIIYLEEMLRSQYPFLVDYNPIYAFITVYQNLFLYAKAPSFEALVYLFIITLVCMCMAAYLYRKCIGTIKDII